MKFLGGRILGRQFFVQRGQSWNFHRVTSVRFLSWTLKMIYDISAGDLTGTRYYIHAKRVLRKVDLASPGQTTVDNPLLEGSPWTNLRTWEADIVAEWTGRSFTGTQTPANFETTPDYVSDDNDNDDDIISRCIFLKEWNPVWTFAYVIVMVFASKLVDTSFTRFALHLALNRFSMSISAEWGQRL